MTEMSERVKVVGDLAAIATVASSWLSLLSQVTTIIATTLAAIWSCIRLYEWWKAKKSQRNAPPSTSE